MKVSELKALELHAQIRKRLHFEMDLKDIRSLRRASIPLRRIYTFDCNGCLRDQYSGESDHAYHESRNLQRAWIDKRMNQLETRIENICGIYGVPYYLQTDCRGTSLYLGTTSNTRYSTEGIPIF